MSSFIKKFFLNSILYYEYFDIGCIIANNPKNVPICTLSYINVY